MGCVHVDIWAGFCETLVILGVDFKVVEVIFVETSGGVILDVAIGFKVVTDTLFETEETRVVDGFSVRFKVVTVTEKTGVIDGFTVLLEDSLVWLKGTMWSIRCGFSSGDFEMCGRISAWRSH